MGGSSPAAVGLAAGSLSWLSSWLLSGLLAVLVCCLVGLLLGTDVVLTVVRGFATEGMTVGGIKIVFLLMFDWEAAAAAAVAVADVDCLFRLFGIELELLLLRRRLWAALSSFFLLDRRLEMWRPAMVSKMDRAEMPTIVAITLLSFLMSNGGIVFFAGCLFCFWANKENWKKRI